MKIVFFNRFFYPDTSATSQLLSDLAFHLAEGACDVHVVTSRVPGGDADLESIRGVMVHRVSRTVAGSHGLARRAIAYVGYYRGARAAARRLLGARDIAVFKTDPPMLSAAIAKIAHQRGARTVAWMQDIFPEVAREYGIPGMKGPVYAFLRHKRNQSLQRADRIVAIGEDMAARLASENIDSARIEVIHNWADATAIRPIDSTSSQLRREWNLTGKFVVCYSGNLGRVHEFDTILGAASKLRDRADIAFVIVGRGPRLREVKAKVAREGISNVVFQRHQERESLSDSLGAADIHLSVLQPRFEGLVLPSKHYGIMAAGRPLVFVGDPGGESARIIAESGCGVSVRTGDVESLALAIQRLADNAAERGAMGRKARAAFEARFRLESAAQRWRALFLHLLQE